MRNIPSPPRESAQVQIWSELSAALAALAHSTFARAAVYSEFRARDARAIDQADFVDRRPDQAPRPHVVDDVLRVVNQQGLER